MRRCTTHARVLDSGWLVDTTINLQGLPGSRNSGFMTGVKRQRPGATGAATLCLLPAPRPEAEADQWSGLGLPRGRGKRGSYEECFV